MNILLIHDFCVRGGHCACMLELARGLMAAGHPTRCFFFEDRGYFDWFAAQCPSLLGDERDLEELLRREHFDVVHGDADMLDLPALLARSGFRGRLAITRHGVKAPVGWHAGNCHAYIAESDSSAALMRPYTDLNVFVAPNFVDTESCQPVACEAPSKPIIAWCGRSTEPFKNFPRYARIIRHLDPEAFTFRVADADGSSLATTEHRNVEGIERIDDWRAYSRSDLLRFFSEVAASGGCILHTAHYEGLPMALLEAMACGCPVVAADVRGVNDALCGPLRRWLYPETVSDAEAAAFLLEALPRFASAEGRAEFRQQVVTRFSREVAVAAYLRAFQGDQSLCADASDPAYRRQIAENLWQFAGEVYRQGNRPRNVLFAARAARCLSARSFWTPARLRMVLRCGLQSRLRSARHLLALSRDALHAGNRRQAARYRLQAIKLHPGALLLRT